MKTFSTIIVAALAALTVSAAPAPTPAPQTITLQTADNKSGANANAVVALDGVPRTFESLYGTSSLVKNGRVLATSSLLNSFPQKFSCAVKNAAGATVGTLTPNHTYINLDGNPNQANEIDVTAFVITCTV